MGDPRDKFKNKGSKLSKREKIRLKKEEKRNRKKDKNTKSKLADEFLKNSNRGEYKKSA